MLNILLNIGTALLAIGSVALVIATFRIQRRVSLLVLKANEKAKTFSSVSIPAQQTGIVDMEQFKAVAMAKMFTELEEEVKRLNIQLNSIPAQSNTRTGSNLIEEYPKLLAAGGR
jgi:HAMP domain-containing protein